MRTQAGGLAQSSQPRSAPASAVFQTRLAHFKQSVSQKLYQSASRTGWATECCLQGTSAALTYIPEAGR